VHLLLWSLSPWRSGRRAGGQRCLSIETVELTEAAETRHRLRPRPAGRGRLASGRLHPAIGNAT